MFEKLFNWWSDLSKNGMYFPFVHDPVTKKPSITLLFPYITFVLAFVSTILLHFDATMILATITSILFWVVSVIFYMLRKLHKAKIDFDDKQIDLEGGDGE